MENIVIRYLDHPTLKDPIFIEGLPGIGNVGKLAAEHLKDELKAVKFAEIFSKYFPPQVLVQEDGQVKLVNNEMHYVKRNGGKDLVLLTGDYQGLTPEGQYELSDFILRELKKLGVRRLFTRGGDGRRPREGDGEVRRRLLARRAGRGDRRRERTPPGPRTAVRHAGGVPDGRDVRILRRPEVGAGRARRTHEVPGHRDLLQRTGEQGEADRPDNVEVEGHRGGARDAGQARGPRVHRIGKCRGRRSLSPEDLHGTGETRNESECLGVVRRTDRSPRTAKLVPHVAPLV